MKKQWQNKQQLRNYIWDMLLRNKIAIFPLPPHGRIPNFKDAKSAAERIRELPEYQNASCIFTGPDAVLRPLRDLILKDGKKLAYATPHMHAFKIIYPPPLGERMHIDTTIKGLISQGIELKENVDIAIIGSVAVDLKGNRIGKGAGYGDKEIFYLKNNNPNLLVGTLVHSSQVMDDFSYLMEPNDIPVDFILTEKGVKKIRKTKIDRNK